MELGKSKLKFKNYKRFEVFNCRSSLILSLISDNIH